MASRVNAKQKDRVLAADYSYFILLMKFLRQLNLQSQNIQEIFKSPDTAFGDYLEERATNLQKFQQKLEEFQTVRPTDKKLEGRTKQQKGKKSSKNEFQVINLETFSSVVAYYEETSAKEFAHYVKKSNKVEDLEGWLLGFLQHLFACLLHFNEKYWKQYVAEVQNTAFEYFEKVAEGETLVELFEDNQNAIIEANETCQIVNDLMINDDANSLDGKMKIVRASTTEDANTLYSSLVLARHVASSENQSYTFEVIRDFGNFKLDNFQRDNNTNIVKPDMVTRVRQVLQTDQCQHREKDTYESCVCKTYSANLPSLVCTNCRHEHTEIRTYKHLNKLPCIVIVILRGRVGDTFPPSFNCMDLRILDNIVEEDQVCLLLCLHCFHHGIYYF